PGLGISAFAMEKLQHFCASCESAMDTDSAGLLRRRMVVVRRLVISNRDFLVSLLLPLPLLTPLTASASSLLVSIEYVAVGQQAICASIIRRSEEHTSELQSPYDLVCRLLLEKKKMHMIMYIQTYLSS